MAEVRPISIGSVKGPGVGCLPVKPKEANSILVLQSNVHNFHNANRFVVSWRVKGETTQKGENEKNDIMKIITTKLPYRTV